MRALSVAERWRRVAVEEGNLWVGISPSDASALPRRTHRSRLGSLLASSLWYRPELCRCRFRIAILGPYRALIDIFFSG
jgi:hypothetical protein